MLKLSYNRRKSLFECNKDQKREHIRKTEKMCCKNIRKHCLDKNNA